MNPKKSITDLPDEFYAGKRVLVRTDFNVPLTPDGSVSSDFRIQETLPTLQYLLDRKAKVIVVTHLGRPKGKPEPQFRLKPVVNVLQKRLSDVPVHDVQQCVGPEVQQAVGELKPGELLVLENIRFEPGETQNDPALAKQLAELADIYVNDAFGAAHRAHASTEGVAHYVGTKVAGLLMKQELATLSLLLSHAEKPFTAIIGGSKVSTKIEVLSKLLQLADNLVIGGGMVFTFLLAKGHAVGASLAEPDFKDTAQGLMQEAESRDSIIVLPKDVVVADRFAPDAVHRIVPVTEIPDGWMGLDLGPISIERIKDVLKNTKTVFWNGPLGVFELPAFANATREIAQAISDLTREGHLTSVLGGGDTQAAIEQFGIPPTAYTHVSTGGGATLEFLEGKELPGVSVLEDRTLTTATST